MSNGNMHEASSQWANRPADERFWTMADLKRSCTASWERSSVIRVPFDSLKAHATGGDIVLTGPGGKAPAHLTHYAFGQLAASVKAPAGFLRSLPSDLTASVLNAKIAQTSDRADRNLLLHADAGRLTLRASVSPDYTRVWDAELAEYLETLTDAGWRPPAGRSLGMGEETRIATAADILPGQINIGVGSEICASGLYASDHDMFCFLVAPDRVIDDGTGKPLMRGVFVKNSEVGDSALTFTFFLMQAVCGNHIVWNARGVHEIRVRHVGRHPMHKAIGKFRAELIRYRDGAAEDERGIMAARNLVLGDKKEDVLTALVKYAGTHSIPLSKEVLSTALDVAAEHTDWYGAPNTLWAAVAGLTHASQNTRHQDEREATDRAAGKLLAMAF